jgi:SAM-dependent methyltransferase
VSTQTMPSPEPILDMLFAYQRSAALKSAITLGVFTAIDEGAQTDAAIAARVGASDRGVRILCDFITVQGLLTKSGDRYTLTPESAAFLSRKSPAYLGTTAGFLTMPEIMRNFDNLTDAVRRGGASPSGSTVSPDNPVWVEFARSMMPMMMPNAHGMAEVLGVSEAGPLKVLDIAAGHGIFGITIAQRNPRAEVAAVDWKAVLAVAEENARAFQVQDRYRTIPGDAFAVDYGSGFDLALVTNFLHHFDASVCTSLLKKVRAALKPGGRVAVLEFVPNADRVSPPMPASFSLTMLAGTEHGEAHTFDELRAQLEAAGFSGVTRHPMPTPETVIVAHSI